MEKAIQKIWELTKLDIANLERSPLDVFLSVSEEYGELAREINIVNLDGHRNKKAGPDGVFGEAIDLLITDLCFIFTEMIYKSPGFAEALKNDYDNPNEHMSTKAIFEMIEEKLNAKLKKWESFKYEG